MPILRPVAIVAAICWFSLGAVFSAEPAGSVQKQLEDEQRRRQVGAEIQRRLSEEREKGPVDDSAVAPGKDGDAKSASNPTFFCRRIVFDPSQVFQPGWLAELAAPYQGREITLRELKGMVSQINNVYRQKGLATARAMLPAQEVVDGVLRVALIEGKVSQVRVQGNRYTRTSMILRSLPSVSRTGQLLEVNELEQDLIRYNKLYNNNLRVELKPGAALAETDVLVFADDAKRCRVAWLSDNLGQESVGEYRQSALLEIDSLTGHRDALTMTGTFADGTNAVYGTYICPVAGQSAEFGLIGSYSDVAVRHGEFKDLGIKGYSYDVGGIVSFALRADKQWLVKANVQFHHKLSSNFVTGFALSNSDEYVSTIGLTAEKTDERGIWYGQVEELFGGGDLGQSEHQAFCRFTGGLARVQFIPDTPLIAIARASGQVSGTDLPALEMFQIGGGTTVRGFPEVLLIGDDGYLASVELSTTVKWLPCHVRRLPLRDSVRLFGFVDHGGVSTRGETSLLPSTLLSAGTGVSLQVDDRISGQCCIGFPIGNYDDVPTVGDYRIHFSLMMAY